VRADPDADVVDVRERGRRLRGDELRDESLLERRLLAA
jgi:hypothetical protein